MNCLTTTTNTHTHNKSNNNNNLMRTVIIKNWELAVSAWVREWNLVSKEGDQECKARSIVESSICGWSVTSKMRKFIIHIEQVRAEAPAMLAFSLGRHMGFSHIVLQHSKDYIIHFRGLRRVKYNTHHLKHCTHTHARSRKLLIVNGAQACKIVQLKIICMNKYVGEMYYLCLWKRVRARACNVWICEVWSFS